MKNFYVALGLATIFLVCTTSSVPVTVSGYVSDVLCYDKCVVNHCTTCALDKTDVIRRPAAHSLHCIRDVKVCVDSGYYLSANQATNGGNNYRPRYRLDSRGNELAIAAILASPKQAGFQATITGDDDGNNNLAVTTLVECTASGNITCDNECTGCISTGYIMGGTLGSVDHDLVVVHGSLLLTAWCFLAPIAFLFKRHQHTPTCPGPKASFFCYKDYPVFFLIHMFLMVTVWFLTLVAVSIALANFGANGERPRKGGHFYVGLVIFILAIWQPLPGFFCRPAVDSPNRKYFNWVHKGVGYPLLLLGLANCFTGVENYRTLWDGCDRGKQFQGAVMAGIVIVAVSTVVLEVYRQYQFCQGKGEHDHHKAVGKSETEMEHRTSS